MKSYKKYMMESRHIITEIFIYYLKGRVIEKENVFAC